MLALLGSVESCHKLQLVIVLTPSALCESIVLHMLLYYACTLSLTITIIHNA